MYFKLQRSINVIKVVRTVVFVTLLQNFLMLQMGACLFDVTRVFSKNAPFLLVLLLATCYPC